jgi:hypothetical protein
VDTPKLALAREQLARAQVAALDPVDWSDLLIYGFHAVENAVVAAAEARGIAWQRTHPSKAGVARDLASAYGLPDVGDLLVDLNSLRKSEAYGEVRPTNERSAEDIVSEIETFVDAVAATIEDEGQE